MSSLLDELLHEYDPAKAREYYLRTRKLKGRGTGSPEEIKAVWEAKRQEMLAHRKEVKAKVEKLEARLKKMRELLRKLVEQAKGRSGVDPKSKSKAPVKKATSAGSAKLTAAQKREAAERAKKYREKNDLSLTDQEKKLNEQLTAVSEKISEARKKIAASKARATQTTTSKKPAA